MRHPLAVMRRASRRTTIAPARDTHRFGLPTATALVVGTIIGVGIFNLPAALASYGPISLVSLALTTVGALALASLRPRSDRWR